MSYFIATATKPVACTPVTIAADIATVQTPVGAVNVPRALLRETGDPTDVPYGALLRDTLAALRADREHIAKVQTVLLPATLTENPPEIRYQLAGPGFPACYSLLITSAGRVQLCALAAYQNADVFLVDWNAAEMTPEKLHASALAAPEYYRRYGPR
ncbi:MAG TPA: hypothetical protein PKH77_25850 [Anaerolineae bacterium]|nr:hypothetical protein [Anaerolineae bacterium]